MAGILGVESSPILHQQEPQPDITKRAEKPPKRGQFSSGCTLKLYTDAGVLR